MTSPSSMLSYPLLLALFLALAQETQGQFESLVPAELLAFIPLVCLPSLNTQVLPCAIGNTCFSLFPTEEEIANIPAEADIQSCVDVEAGLCPITSRCDACKDIVDEFFKCIIINSEGGLMANTTELVTNCSLDCTLIATDPPVPVPTEAPVEVVTVPTSSPVASESSVPFAEPEIAEVQESESGAMTMVVSSVAVVSAVTSFVLGW